MVDKDNRANIYKSIFQIFLFTTSSPIIQQLFAIQKYVALFLRDLIVICDKFSS